MLPKELTSLIRKVSNIYGEAIKDVHGTATYQKVEKIRQDMKSGRGLHQEDLYKLLKKNYSLLSKASPGALFDLAHIFSVYLELVNRCEAAYRHDRLADGPSIEIEKSPHAVIFVFTAHPTEARSERILGLIKYVDDILRKMLDEENSILLEEQLGHLLKIILKTSVSKSSAPEVIDEAYQIYSVVLDPKALKEQIALYKKGITVHFRTWVGGDKDGHPYVNHLVMLGSLELSRNHLLDFIKMELEASFSLCKNMDPDKEIKKLLIAHDSQLRSIHKLRKIASKDGLSVKKYILGLKKLCEFYSETWGELNSHLETLKGLVWLYPALVLPLELREDAEIAAGTTGESKKIHDMLKLLKTISTGHDPKWYVRGFVLSMVHSAQDITNGINTIKRHFKDLAIPVVPLFETKSALENSKRILEDTFKQNPQLVKHHKKHWNSRFEIMLGYSDSAKENGTLTGRYLIAKTLSDVDLLFKKFNLSPVFFHGSGGSVERGGGSIKGQISWWPKSALNIFKSTVQGEMVTRNFGDPLVMKSIVSKVCHQFDKGAKPKKEKFPKSFDQLVRHTNERYQEFVTREKFPEFVQKATPYSYLSDLKIGSRPSSRNKDSNQFKLRAIPWVLCWTQTRMLFPTWWGMGTAWEKLDAGEKYEIMQFYGDSNFFKSFMKILGFTLAKVELNVFRLYLEQSYGAQEGKEYFNELYDEYEKVKTFFYEVTRKKDFLWFRPWLGESIRLRSPMIHPLNLIQLISFEKKDTRLLRETVTGIASGMMTTG